MGKILLLGEPLVLFTSTKVGSLSDAPIFKKSVAGAELNVAIGLTRLNHDVEFISKLGNDFFGEFIFDKIREEGISTDYILRTDEYSSGIMFKDKVVVGDPNTQYYRDNSAFTSLGLSDLNVSYNDVDLVHITGIPLAVSSSVRKLFFKILNDAKNNGITITFDPNLRSSLWRSKSEMIETLNKVAEYVDIILPGLSEGRKLTNLEDPKEIAYYYLKKGIKKVVIKLGEKGALLYTNENEEMIPSHQVKDVIDTVGAGDGFAVGFIHGVLNEKSAETCVNYGNLIGSLQVQSISDNDALPTLDIFNNLIKNE